MILNDENEEQFATHIKYSCFQLHLQIYADPLKGPSVILMVRTWRFLKRYRKRQIRKGGDTPEECSLGKRHPNRVRR